VGLKQALSWPPQDEAKAIPITIIAALLVHQFMQSTIE
jgi:hypothetical protein